MFISSTFRDMQSERDFLVRFVFPKLRQELLQRRIHLVDVDLRWGVTSEQDALSVCREVVDECRPRFLCMLGGRYGWVPPKKTRSITADEVHYGILDRDLKSRGFAYFYFRDPSATAAMVEAAPGEFREPAYSHGASALAALKTAITEAGLQPFIYQAQWDDQSRRMIGLKEFGDRVHADLNQSIDQEFGTTTGEKPDEFTEENAAMEAFIEERVQRFVLGSRLPVWNELRQHAESTGGNGRLCLTGAAGSGKSALLGKFCQDYQAAHPQDLVIPHFVGASPGSTDVRRTLRRLCHELVTGAGLTAEIPEDPEKLRMAFAEILQQASAQKRVVILLDAINQFDPTPQLAGWSWLPEELPANARIILSAMSEVRGQQSAVSDQSSVISPMLESLRHRRNPPTEIKLQPLTAEDAEAIIREFLHRYRKSMTDDQRVALLAKADAGSPLYLLVALEELRTLGTYEEITDRISQLPPDTRALFIWILKRLENDDGFRDASGRMIGRELVSRFVSLLGVSRHGLSQQELVGLLSPGDSQGNVAALVQLLRLYLMQRGELLDFYHGEFREAVGQAYLEDDDKKLKAHTELAEYFHGQDYWCESVEAQRQRSKRLPPTPRPTNVRKVTELPWQRITAAELSGEWDAVERLFTDLFFLEAKAEAGLVFDLVIDFGRVVAEIPAGCPLQRILRLLAEALRRDVHFVARHPTTLFQSVWNLCWWFDGPGVESNGEPHRSSQVRTVPTLSALMDAWRSTKEAWVPGFHWLRTLRPPGTGLGGPLVSVLLGHRTEVTSIAVSACGGHIASSDRGSFRLWSSASGAEEVCFPEGHEYHSLDYSSDSKLLLAMSRYSVDLLNPDTGEVLQSHSPDDLSLLCTAMSPNASKLLIGGIGTGRRPRVGLLLLDWDTGTTIPYLSTDESAYGCIAVSRDGTIIAGGTTDGELRCWNAADGSVLCQVAAHKGWINALAFSPDGRWLATAGRDNAIHVWNPRTGVRLRSLDRHTSKVTCLAVFPDGRYLVSGSGEQHLDSEENDNTLWVWAVEAGVPIAHLVGHEKRVTSVAVNPHNCHIVSASADKSIRIWDVELQNAAQAIHYATQGAAAAAQSAASDEPKCVQCHANETTIEKAKYAMQVYSDSRRLLAAASDDGSIAILDGNTNELMRKLLGHRSVPVKMTWSPDQSLLASAGSDQDREVRVWDLANGRQLRLFADHCTERQHVRTNYDIQIDNSVLQLLFAVGGKVLISRTAVSIRGWNVATGEQLFCFSDDDHLWLGEMAVSADVSYLAATEGNREIYVWNTQTRQRLTFSYEEMWSSGLVQLRSNFLRSRDGGNVCWIAFAPDGSWLVAQCTDLMGVECVEVWGIPDGEIIATHLGTGDVIDIALGAGQRPYIQFSSTTEATVESALHGLPVAWYPRKLWSCGGGWATDDENEVVLEPSSSVTYENREKQ